MHSQSIGGAGFESNRSAAKPRKNSRPSRALTAPFFEDDDVLADLRGRVPFALFALPVRADTGMEPREEEEAERRDEERYERIALLCVGRDQRDAGEQRRPRPEDDDRAPWSVTEAHEAVMEMARIRLVPALPVG